jgi:hypothetical protein
MTSDPISARLEQLPARVKDAWLTMESLRYDALAKARENWGDDEHVVAQSAIVNAFAAGQKSIADAFDAPELNPSSDAEKTDNALAALVRKYKSGAIPRDCKLWLDNDDASVYTGETGPPVFEMDPRELLEQALDLLGIPHEHV